MEDQQIIDLLFARDETGLRQTEEKYVRLYKSILRETLKDESDVEECSNDVLMAIWSSIPPQFPNHFPTYICAIARRIGINRYKFNTRQKRGRGYTVLLSELGDCLVANPQMEVSEWNLRQILKDFLKNLDPQTRVLFLRRYYYLEPVKNLAKRFAVSENYISVRLHRARKQLRSLLEKEGVSL